MGSPVHLSKTIMNLVSNGSEAMADGGLLKIVTRNVFLDTLIEGYEEVKKGSYVSVEISPVVILVSQTQHPSFVDSKVLAFHAKQKKHCTVCRLQ